MAKLPKTQPPQRQCLFCERNANSPEHMWSDWMAGQRLTTEGVIVISAQRFRTQERNREDAIERLVALIRAAAQPPKPRRPTKPTKAAKAKRLEGKRTRSGVKAARAKPGMDD
jgi:ribosome-associated protein